MKKLLLGTDVILRLKHGGLEPQMPPMFSRSAGLGEGVVNLCPVSISIPDYGTVIEMS
jgi:hypothetical protein